MKAYVFPGQGSQAVGMAEELCKLADTAKEYLEMADDILGYNISEIMTTGTKKELKETRVTQPAMFIFSVVKARINRNFKPDIVAGHSLGEFSALAAIRVLSFADGLRLVAKRAEAMHKLCIAKPSKMAAVLGLDNAITESVCAAIDEAIVVPANYNCPSQLVISGSSEGIAIAKVRLKEAGARTVIELPVAGAFHSPLMEPASQALEEAIRNTRFKESKIPIYQNVTGFPTQDPEEIQENLIAHLTSPVKWMQCIENMVEDGARQFIEVAPESKSVLQNMIKRINSRVGAACL